MRSQLSHKKTNWYAVEYVGFYNIVSSTELFTLTNQELKINVETKEIKFINALKNLRDTRDNRGKRHSLVILVVTFVFATLVNRSKVSSIHRYMSNRIGWLRGFMMPR